MGANSNIEWTDHTFNPWQGCSKVSSGCQNCYAEALTQRFGVVKWGDAGTRVRTSESYWKEPLKWDRKVAAAGTRARVFCASLADVFEDRPELTPWRTELIDLIDQTPHLDWLLVTKRPENVNRLLHLPSFDGSKLREWPMPNVWIGTSVENQEQADIRLPELLKIPAKVRFLSMEPLIGPVDLERVGACLNALVGISSGDHWLSDHGDKHINWVIVGGESGHGARPMHPDWARSLRDQCQAAGVPFFFKQWGEWREMHADELPLQGKIQRFSGGPTVIHVGKHAAGRILDGRTWDELPEVPF